MQKFFKSELGRSMVEMLGVLALVGVLSVAAIAGYSYAITKWKAGEVLSDLHVRALEYTRQMAMQKKFASDFAFENFDLGNENALGNPVAGYPLYDDPDFFEIEVRGVSAEVCRQIIRDADRPILGVAVNGSDWGALEESCGADTPGNLVTMTFLFSKTLEDAGAPLEAPAEVTKPRPDDCPATRWANIAGVCCAEDEIGTGGHCCPKTSTGWGQNVDRCCRAGERLGGAYDKRGEWSYFCCPLGSFWNSDMGRCIGEDTKKCASNDDCLANEYCDLNNGNSCSSAPTQGVCLAATVSRTKTIDAVTYKRSAERMDWWSAHNFCARLGGSMVSLETFGCGFDFVSESVASGYCNEDATYALEAPRSETIKKFGSLSGGSDYVWTTDIYPADTCRPYLVYFYSGYLTNNFKYFETNYQGDNNFTALCRMDP